MTEQTADACLQVLMYLPDQRARRMASNALVTNSLSVGDRRSIADAIIACPKTPVNVLRVLHVFAPKRRVPPLKQLPRRRKPNRIGK